eukprot:TRINITY_DN4083_c0_g1_i1.p1 TRINITY_DN4083_c0_g1~~TRINITY_DN4083_c0_g1_i1.p1  ORF type:complete len:671 (-),score=101.94 TRINITY_DN4083_c0_g1_i1:45-1937(-)
MKNNPEPQQTYFDDPFWLAHVVLGYLFWSTFVEVIPILWYFPLEHLGVTGWEFVLVLFFLPCLFLSFSWLRSLVSRYLGVFHALGVLGLFTYYAPNLPSRVLLLVLFTSIGMVGRFAMIWNPRSRDSSTWGLLLGLITLLSFRFGFNTLNPVWINATLNGFAVFLGIFSSLILGSEPDRNLTIPKPKPKRHIGNHWLPVGIGFGTLLFTTQWLVTSHVVLPRWLDLPTFPYGIGSIYASLGGLFVSLWFPSFSQSLIWYLIAMVSSVCLIYTPKNIGIYAGYVVISFLVSLWPGAVNSVRKFPPGRTIAVTIFVYILEQLAIIWTVAYNFVPLGEYMRERTTQVFLVVMVITKMACPMVAQKPLDVLRKDRLPNKKIVQTVVMIILVILGPSFYKRSLDYGETDHPHVGIDQLRSLMWAVHFGYDNGGWNSFDSMSNFIKNSKANIIGLVETDTARPYMGNRDVLEWLEEDLHMYSDYGPSTLNNTWGCGLLSAFPILSVVHENLPSPEGEIACLIDATLNVSGKLIDVIVVHFGNTEHYLDRELQAKFVYELVSKKVRPVVWLGYLTDRPGSKNYKTVVSSGLLDTTRAMDRYCLYIFYKNLELLNFERLDRGSISDTEGQVATFALPR